MKTAEAISTDVENPIKQGAQLAPPEPESTPVPKKLRTCPKHPKNPETITLQGDPHVRCAWCHAVLD